MITPELFSDDHGFDDLELIPPIRKAIKEKCYSQPTPIQSKVIPHLLKGSDVLGCAQTGTGKTGAFALPILQRLAAKPQPSGLRKVSALILTPTRELAAQIGDNFRFYGRYLNVRSAVVYGGVGYRSQIKTLERGVDVLIATPGRLIDLLNQGYFKLDQAETFVLDEADRMLDMGFLPDIRKIMAILPLRKQTMLFSATLPDGILDLAKQFLKNPVKVSATPNMRTAANIDQRVMFVDRENKPDLLASVFDDVSIRRALVFTRTKFGANRIAQKLNRKEIKAEALHGDKSQSSRLDSLRKFRAGKARVLVATDIASRGLDIEGVTHVINYELPNEPDSYIHRVGRTARAGSSGVALSFCDKGECTYLRRIENATKSDIAIIENHPYHSKDIAAIMKRNRKNSIRGDRKIKRKKRPWKTNGNKKLFTSSKKRQSGRKLTSPSQNQNNVRRIRSETNR